MKTHLIPLCLALLVLLFPAGLPARAGDGPLRVSANAWVISPWLKVPPEKVLDAMSDAGFSEFYEGVQWHEMEPEKGKSTLRSSPFCSPSPGEKPQGAPQGRRPAPALFRSLLAGLGVMAPVENPHRHVTVIPLKTGWWLYSPTGYGPESRRLALPVILVGTNNIGKDGKPERAADAADGVAALVEVCRAKVPGATIVVMAIFPRNDSPAGNALIAEANRAIARLADGVKVRFMDINDQLADSDGKLFEGVTVDRLHLSVKGYEIWARNLVPVLAGLLGPRAGEDHASPPTGDPRAGKRRPSS
jgi:hypothetical protein